MMRSPRSFAVLGLALLLSGSGFVAGYGFRSRATARVLEAPTPSPNSRPNASADDLSAPLVKGLRASPDGRWLAFTGIYDGSNRAGVWLVASDGSRATMRPSPAGWQDYVAAWHEDGRGLLLERERIPRPTAPSRAGLYETPIDPATGAVGDQSELAIELPPGERLLSSALAPDGRIVLRTRREPKSLFTARRGATDAAANASSGAPGQSLDSGLERSGNGTWQLNQIDSAGGTLSQNRPIERGGRAFFLNVRDDPAKPGLQALYRVEAGRATRLSPEWDDVSWSYLAPSGRTLLLARALGEDWLWSLYEVDALASGPDGVSLVREAVVPGDVIAVYWSPDESRVLGAAGSSLWRIDIPTLAVVPLDQSRTWDADDATWLDPGRMAIVAAGGELWRLDTQTGASSRLWRFPDEFWS